MRALIVLSVAFLVSCASPEKNPEAFYGETYAPSNFVLEENEFVASAAVMKVEDLEIAEKAAYLRLMKSAKAKGYRYFKVTDSGDATLIGSRFTVKGQLYKSFRSSPDVFPLDEIEKLLRGAKMQNEAPKPVVVATKEPKVLKKAPVRTPKPAAVAVEPGGPTVIMAPDDITGTIGGVQQDIDYDSNAGTPETSNHFTSNIHIPYAVSDIPTGVVIRKKRKIGPTF